MLIFMPTERDIHETAKALRSRGLPGDTPQRQTEILPLYARLSAKDQQRVFHPGGNRRIVIATNVAESSLTVPRIRFVIDPGTARISRYSARSKIQRLPVEPVSQASADQRMGRCGRVGPGICVRLFSEEDYLARERFATPEILRTNLAWVILQTKALRLGDIERFPFLDPPRPDAIRDGFKTLFELGAVDEDDSLTETGRRMARIPVDPRIGRMILAAADEGCLGEVLVIASALEIQDPRERPLEKQEQADACHAPFADPDSDFLSYLKLWDFFQELRRTLSRNHLRKACRQHFLSFNRMREWLDIHRQLLQLVEQAGVITPARKLRNAVVTLRVTEPHHAERDDYSLSCRGNVGTTRGQAREGQQSAPEPAAEQSDQPVAPPAADPTGRQIDYAAIHRAILTGLLSNLGFRTGANEYTVPGGQVFYLWPGSALFLKRPTWLVAAELVETSRRYLRICARINSKWIEPAAAHLVKRFYSDPFWDRASASAIAYEKVSLLGLVIVPRRRVPYGPIDPAAARELLIQCGLVEGKWNGRAEFLVRNAALLEQMERLQRKLRRHDLLRGEWACFEFYDRRIPDTVYDGPRLKQWLRRAEQKNPGVLWMTAPDLLNEEITVDASDFPDSLPLGGAQAPLDYRFDPAADDDGLTLTVPVEALGQVDPERLEWLVPGLVERKIVAMIRALPKPLRRSLVPAPETARRVLGEIQFGQGSLSTVVARVPGRIAGQQVSPEAFQPDKIPDDLRMNVRVVDADGGLVVQGRNLAEIRLKLGEETARRFAEIDDGPWRRDGLTSWDLDELPEEIQVGRNGMMIKAYPMLIDQGQSVSLRLSDCLQTALHETRGGLRRLFLFDAYWHITPQVDWLPGLERMQLLAASIERFDLRQELCGLVAERAFLADRPIPRTRAEFETQREAGRERIGLAVQDVAAVVGPLLEAHHETRLALEKAGGSRWRYAIDDMWDQFRNLVAAGFLTATPWPWLRHAARYLRAIRERLERLSGGNLARDQVYCDEILTRWHAYLAQSEQDRQRGLHNPDLTTYRWMLEEYRVSLFAQKLGTAMPVSAKRLDQQWQKAVGGD
jgi:ATP-dependent helicase HrpA